MKNPIEYYQKVLQTNPDDVNTQLRLAAAWREHGRDDLALDLYVEASRALMRKGWALQAAAACKSVLEIDPAHSGTMDLLDELAQSETGSVSQIAASIAASSRRKRGELEQLGLVPASRPELPVFDRDREYAERHSAKTVEVEVGPLPRRTPRGPLIGADTVPAGSKSPWNNPTVDFNLKAFGTAHTDETKVSTDTVSYALSPEDQQRAMDAMAREMEVAKRESQVPERPSIRSIHDQQTVVGPPPTLREDDSALTNPTVDFRPAPAKAPPGLPPLNLGVWNNEPGRANTADTVVAHISRASPTPPPAHGERPQRVQRTSRVAPSMPRLLPDAPTLPESTLFDAIPWDVTRELIQRLGVRHVTAGSPINDHFSRQLVFVVDGLIEISIKTNEGPGRVAAQIGAGDFFGESAILTGKAPTAMASVARDGRILVVPEAEVSNLVEYDPHLWDKLWDRHDRAVLDTALTRSKLFGTLPLAKRRKLADAFDRYDVDGDQLIIGQGEAGHGMYLVLRGAVEVTRQLGDELRVLGVLKQGKFFGTVQATPSKATVKAKRPSSLFVLVRESLVKLLDT